MQGLNIILVCYFVNIIIINFLLYYILNKCKKYDDDIKYLKDISQSIKRHDNNNHKNIEALLNNVLDRLDNIEVRLNKIENRLDNIEVRLNILEQKVDVLEVKVVKIEKKVDVIEKKVEIIENKVDVLENDVDNLKKKAKKTKKIITKKNERQFT